ncbi:MAG TPA: asparagine synthase (glutamine-hydrolyzing) [Longimicrobiales bacterium]|nr:asparagine synthase (glutamine-hydrolyzing) [Longimicrobiales bacterium]
MCGIAGIISLDAGRPVDTAPLPLMLDCLRHRGPDDEGTFLDDGVALGHRRLSVIDVEHGHQPLRGQRDSTVAIVNGEVYNYRALAGELRARGSRFRTASDSEVAAHAYDAWGVDCLDRFDGMFALAIWDGAARRLLLARDRMGEKPLFHTVADGMLLFASELSALLAHPAVHLRIDACALREYLALDYVPAPHSLIEGVHKLEPGCALVMEQGSIRTLRYWGIDTSAPRSLLTYDEAVRELRTRLDAAVHSRLVSDVPLGVFLSGGIDSSTVAALAARHGALETFAIGFDEPSFDESSHARTVAHHIGSHHHEHVVRGADMTDLVPRLGALMDEPIGDASILPTAVLSRFARRHVTVALGGDGGDELFAGYPMHQAHRIAPITRALPRPLMRGATAAASALPVSHGNFSLGFRATTFLRGAAAPPPRNHALWMSSFTPAEQEALLTPDVLHRARNCDPLAALERHWRESDGAAPLLRATHLDATTYLPDDILVKVDRASMAVALEVRAPFLARDVVEFAFAMPDAWRMRGLTGKRILRDAVRDLLPPAILGRPKKGFGMPVAAWLDGPLRDMAHDLLGSSALAGSEFFQPHTVQRLLDRHARREADLRKPIWNLLVFELWRREQVRRATGSAGRAA